MNTNALKAQMVLRGIKMCDLASVMGISQSALYRKMNKKSYFTQKEISIMIDYLKIENPMHIFFNEKVS